LSSKFINFIIHFEVSKILSSFIFSHATSSCYCYFYKLLIKAYATDIENARNNIIAVNIYPVNIAIKHPPIKANHINSSIIQPPVVFIYNVYLYYY